MSKDRVFTRLITGIQASKRPARAKDHLHFLRILGKKPISRLSSTSFAFLSTSRTAHLPAGKPLPTHLIRTDSMVPILLLWCPNFSLSGTCPGKADSSLGNRRPCPAGPAAPLYCSARKLGEPLTYGEPAEFLLKVARLNRHRPMEYDAISIRPDLRRHHAVSKLGNLARCCLLSGARGRNRTTDTRIFNPLLYP